MSALFAFLHHVAAFALVATLALEFVLIRDAVSAESARRLRGIDSVYGAAAGILLVVGLLRVFYFEKGWAYYSHSVPFHIKITLFIAVGLLSIYPTATFISWKKSLNVDEKKLRTVRRIIHWELAAVLGILLCAALMARGIGYYA